MFPLAIHVICKDISHRKGKCVCMCTHVCECVQCVHVRVCDRCNLCVLVVCLVDVVSVMGGVYGIYVVYGHLCIAFVVCGRVGYMYGVYCLCECR